MWSEYYADFFLSQILDNPIYEDILKSDFEKCIEIAEKEIDESRKEKNGEYVMSITICKYSFIFKLSASLWGYIHGKNISILNFISRTAFQQTWIKIGIALKKMNMSRYAWNRNVFEELDSLFTSFIKENIS